ncbi:MAG TPA: threonine/serine dehydratase [Kofleriaceae bacterium]|nr:threonine/serine dehydratase [Kofleriaceae bacterium]
MSVAELPSPTHADVVAAAARLRGQVVRTPVVRSASLDRLAGAELWLKAESLQHVGAFKARGALNAVGQLDEETRRRGVITYSSGNHAQAVAMAAARFGIGADIFMPVDAPAIKLAAVKEMGARVVLVGTTSPERHRAALARQAETGAAIIEPFDSPHTIAGQGTATLELLEEADAAGVELDAIVVPVGGGGLIAGACLATEGRGIPIHAVEPVGCDSMGQSMRAGAVVPVDPAPTLADGLKPTRVGELPFAIARRAGVACHTVTDDELAAAVAHLALRAKLVVEPSGAAGVALVLRSGALPRSLRHIGVILSGGNVAPERLAELLARAVAAR